MALLKLNSQQVWGGAIVVGDDPAVSVHRDLYYLPYVENGQWGIFDSLDQVVQASVDTWLPEKLPLRQNAASNCPYYLINETLPDGVEYIYGGRFTAHFGHFIIETLSRLWPLTTDASTNRKIVMHGDCAPALWWELPYASDMFGALGLTPDDIIWLDKPFRIPKLTIPGPSFEPQDFAHTAFTRLCRRIGRSLMSDLPRTRVNHRPVYLSKTRLPHGVRRIINEQAIIDVLERHGIEILYPEQMPFPEKLKLLATRSVVSGSVMSGHHMSVFLEPTCRFELISPAELLNSNFLLIDRLNGNRSSYYFPEGTRLLTEGVPPFMVDHFVEDPAATARELLCHL